MLRLRKSEYIYFYFNTISISLLMIRLLLCNTKSYPSNMPNVLCM